MNKHQKKLMLIGLVISSMIFLFGNNVIGRLFNDREPTVDKTGFTENSASKNKLNQKSLRLMLLINKSRRVNRYPEQIVNKEEIIPLLDYINNNGGEITIGTIGLTSKKVLEVWEKKDSVSYDEFLNRPVLNEIFNYENLTSSTQNLSSAVEIANLKLTENKNKFENSRKVVIFITDGSATASDRDRILDKFCCEIIVICRSQNVKDLNKFNPKIFTSFNSAVDYIVNQ